MESSSSSQASSSQVCEPNSTQSCYTGPDDTQGVGSCRTGIKTCLADGSGFGACTGEVLPDVESCVVDGDEDCDGKTNEEGEGCVCVPASTTQCYTGPDGTLDVGICKGGSKTCNADGKGYGPCEGETTPGVESCMVAGDEDCDGKTNEEEEGCVCEPASTTDCYTGPDGTLDVGICKEGSKTCNADGKGYGPCEGETVPGVETCMVDGDEDCDGKTNEEGEGCVCVPGTQADCYSGPPGTVDVGPCKAGTMTCNASGTGYSPCTGEVIPFPETCLTPVDDNCNGQTNEGGDGCVCLPLEQRTCYTGPPGTLGVGLCQSGLAECNVQGTALGPCLQEVTPQPEQCTTPEDEDCDGLVPPCPAKWAHAVGDAADQFVWGAAVDSTGRLAVVGQIWGTVDFGGGALASAGISDAVVAVMDGTGAHAWSKRLGDASLQALHAVAIAPNGDVVVAGFFHGSVSLGAATLTSAGGADILVVRMDAWGNPIWMKRFGSTSDDQMGLAVAVNANGDVLLAGGVTGSVNFGGGTLTSQGQMDIFVVKLDANGNHLWSKIFGDAGQQLAQGIAVGPYGQIAVVGSSNGAVDFGGGALQSTGGHDAVMVVMDGNGSMIWSRMMGGAAQQLAHGVAVDSQGNVVVVGEFEGTLDPGTGHVLQSHGNSDGFVVRFNAAGAGEAVLSFGGLDHDAAYAVACQGERVAVAGHLQGLAWVGTRPVTGNGLQDMLLIRMDTSTLTPDWVRVAGDHAPYQVARAVGFAPDGSILLAGHFEGTMDLGAAILTSAGGPDVFVANMGP